MTTRLDFEPDSIRRAVILAKLTKPATNDLVLKFTGGRLVVFSQGRRGQSWAEVEPMEDAGGFESDEAFLPYEKALFLESVNDSVSLVFDDRHLNIKVKSGSSNRNARIPLRNNDTKRAKLPSRIEIESGNPIDKKIWSDVLSALSFSAQVKNTKTDIEMRQNQIYFYANENAAYSNARVYASSASHDSLNFDVSIIASDVPVIRNFLQKGPEAQQIAVVENHLVVAAADGSSYVAFARMQNKFPPYKIPDPENFRNSVELLTEEWKKNVNWTLKAVEGSNKIRVVCTSESVILMDGPKELVSFPALGSTGEFSFDTNLEILIGISSVINADKFDLFYGHPMLDNMIEFRDRGPVSARHFFTSVKG